MIPEESPSSIGGGVRISSYLRVLVRGWLWIISFLLIGVLLAIGLLSLVAPSYTATTSVNVNVISIDPFNSQRSASVLLDPQTEASIATSFVVAQAAAQRLGEEGRVAELRATILARPVADATILTISSSASNAELARRQTDTIADEYLKYRETQAETRKAAILDSIQTSLEELQIEYGKASSNAQRSAIQGEADGLRQRRNDLVDINTSGGSILDPAAANPVVISPSRVIVVASGALAGVVLGIIAAFVARLLSRWVTSLDDVAAGLGTDNVMMASRLTPAALASASALGPLRRFRDTSLMHSASADEGRALVTIVHNTTDDRLVLLVATMFAQRLGEPQVVLAGLPNHSRELLIDRYDLVPSTGAHLRSRHLSGLELCIGTLSDDVREPDPVLTRDIVTALDDQDRSTVLVVPTSTGEASRRAAGVQSDLVVAIVESRLTSRKELSRIATELAEFGHHVAGAILVHPAPKGSREGARSGQVIDLSGFYAHAHAHAGTDAADAADGAKAEVVVGRTSSVDAASGVGDTPEDRGADASTGEVVKTAAEAPEDVHDVDPDEESTGSDAEDPVEPEHTSKTQTA